MIKWVEEVISELMQENPDIVREDIELFMKYPLPHGPSCHRALSEDIYPDVDDVQLKKKFLRQRLEYAPGHIRTWDKKLWETQKVIQDMLSLKKRRS